MVKLLKEMLQLEAKDKEFLLSNITRITEGKGENDELNGEVFISMSISLHLDWLYDHINFDDVENSSTWNYKHNYKAPDVDSNRNYQSNQIIHLIITKILINYTFSGSSHDQAVRNRRY